MGKVSPVKLHKREKYAIIIQNKNKKMGQDLERKKASSVDGLEKINSNRPLAGYVAKELAELRRTGTESTDDRVRGLIMGYYIQRYYITIKYLIEDEKEVESLKGKFGEFASEYIKNEGEHLIDETYELADSYKTEEEAMAEIESKPERDHQFFRKDDIAMGMFGDIQEKLNDVFQDIKYTFEQKMEEEEFAGQKVNDMRNVKGKQAARAVQQPKGKVQGNGAG